ncbi:MAG: alpha/beta fold hydrolase [Acidimicrobiales bacterium]
MDRRRSWRAALALVVATTASVLLPTVGAGASSTTSQPAPPAVPEPFGTLTCTPEYGIRFCPGGTVGGKDLRVPSFDGVPLDADVALPATGKGPFPLIVLLHGLGGSKHDWEVTSDNGGVNDVSLADRGYAVLMYTARGFGDSCGTAASRANTPDCAKGWIQLADQRYEIRDTQYLAGMLVDEGLVRPNIAVSGVSYGGGQALELAMLKNRMRLPSGKLVRFTSPQRHVPMSVAAVYAMWPWDDLATALVPNGRLLSTANTPPATDIVPVGVGKESWINDLYFETAENYLAPPGADPQTDLTTWKQEILAGEPYSSTEAKALSILQTYKSAIGVPMPAGGPAPTAIQSGWTDTLFPASEALHYANRVRASGARTPMLLMFDDVGHGWAQDKPADVSATTARGLAFLNSVMLTHRQPPTGVVAIPTTCPASAPSGSPRTGATLAVLQSTPLSLSGSTPQTVTSTGGSPTVAASLNAAYVSKLCNPLPATAEPGTAVYKVPAGPAGATLMGAVSVTATIKVTGNYPELVGRLWDVSPSGTRQIVALGVVRPFVNQKPGTKPTAKAAETLTFDLDPNNYTFAPGDTVELELVGSTAPLFRKSNGTFTVTVDHLVAKVPTEAAPG